MKKLICIALGLLLILNVVPVVTAQNPSEEGTVVADTGFRPEVNGFAFPNYGSDFPATNLTPADMHRMFGDQVCAQLRDNECVLAPAAAQWMEQNNAAMGGGHCEGFAVLSQLIYGGKVDPLPLGAEMPSEMNLEGNEPLQRELAYWWTTQATIWDKQLSGGARDLVTFLVDAYTKDPTALYRVGVSKADGSGGHAITAWAVVDMGDGIYRIMVYDNNFPGQHRYIEVDTNSNTWQYEASINPQVEPDLYTGDDNNPMMLAPDEPRLGFQPCEFCGMDAVARMPGLAAPVKQVNQVWMEGDAQLLIADDQGRRLGYDQFRERLENVEVVVEEWPDPVTLRQAHVHHPAGLLGFYHGVPQTERTTNYGMVLPDKITIYRQPILRRCRGWQEVRELTFSVVRHEIAHHFGISDDRLLEIGAY